MSPGPVRRASLDVPRALGLPEHASGTRSWASAHRPTGAGPPGRPESLRSRASAPRAVAPAVQSTDVRPPLVRYPPPVVLVVDEDARVRAAVGAALKELAVVLEAEDGERAFRILQKRGAMDLDLMLVDYVLPDRSGLEVLRLTKRSWPWIPVVIITGIGSEELAVRALRAGASDYLKKPIRPDTLREMVRALTTPRLELAGRNVKIAVDRSNEETVGHPNIRRAITFVREHFTEDITLADVAREAGLSRFHFCRLFHLEAGVSLRAYLHNLRVNRAKVLLADRGLTVTEVAYTVGFNDLSHFDRTFCRMVGRSPTEYRRSLTTLTPSPKHKPS